MSQINRISKSGLELIKSFEGLRRRSEPLAQGGWIVGYGHTRSAREGVSVTEREAEYLLRYDLQDVESFVGHHIHAPLNQNEFDALVSFCWNVGKDAFEQSDVLNYVNAGEMLAAAESFSAWRKARIGGRLIVVDALVRRRTAEKNLFLSHPNGPPSAPSQIVKPELDVAASVLALSDGALSIEARMNAPDSRTGTAALPDFAANDQFQQTGYEEALVDEALAEQEHLNGHATDDEVAAYDDSSASHAEEPFEIDAEDGFDPDIDADDDEDELETVWDESEVSDDADQDIPEDATLDDELSRAMAAASLAADDETLAEDTETTTDDLSEAFEAPSGLDVPETIRVDVSEVEDIPPVSDTLEHVEDDLQVELAEDDEENLPGVFVDEREFEGDDESDTLVDETVATASAGFISSLAVVDDGKDTQANEDSAPVVDEEADTVEVAVEGEGSSADVLAFKPVALDSDEDGQTVLADKIEDEVSPAEADSDTVWNGETDQAFVADNLEYDSTEETPQEAARRIVIDDIGNPTGMSREELEELQIGEDVQLSGQRKKDNPFIGMLPFLLLTIIGIVTMVLGIMDWLPLIRSEAPVDENELYAGPFLTLIGGFVLVFGLYFTARKLFARGD